MTQKEIDNIIESIPCILVDDVKFVLTGTFVLTMFGLLDGYNDVDILVINASSDFWPQLLDKYQNDLAEGSPNTYNCVKINRNGITYNFIEDNSYVIEKDSTNLWVDTQSLFIDSIPHALTAKWNLGRDKDKQHFNVINQRLRSLLSISEIPMYKCCTTYELIWKFAEKVIKFAKQLKFSHMFAKILYLIVSLILCLGEPTFDDMQTVIIYEAFAISNLIASTVIILKSKKNGSNR